MFFKNALIYQFTAPAQAVIDAFEQKDDYKEFVPCGPVQSLSVGFVPCGYDEDSPILYQSDHLAAFRIKIQEKKIPTAGLRELVDEKCKEIEATQDRKVYRKERLSISEDIESSRLPGVIPVSKVIGMYIDSRLNMFVIDTSSDAQAELCLSLLREHLGSFPIRLPEVVNDPRIVMTGWLRSPKIAEPFSLGFSCELKDPCEGGPVHRIKDEDLIADSVQEALREGKQVTALRLRSEDVDFTLSEAYKLKSMVFSDELIQQNSEYEEEDTLRFEADLKLMTSALHDVIPKIGKAFGGWFEQENLDLTDGND